MARAGELDGASAHSGMLSQWPLQFVDRHDFWCLDVHSFINQSLFGSAPTTFTAQPQFGLVWMNETTALAAAELHAANRTDPTDPAVIAVMDAVAMHSFLQSGQLSWNTFTATRTERVDGTVEITRDYSQVGLSDFTTTGMAKLLHGRLSRTEDEQERTRMEKLYLQEGVTYYVSRVCTAPVSLAERVVHESSPYGLASFLADVGGFLNLLALAMAVLFPLVKSATQPRTFVPFWLQRNFRALCSSHEHEDAAHRHDESREMEQSSLDSLQQPLGKVRFTQDSS
jgi:hypothetical protein